MKKFKTLLKRLLIAILVIALISLLVFGGHLLVFSIIIVGAVKSCQNESAARASLGDNRIELSDDYYEIVYSELVSIKGALWSYEIPGISSDDIVFLGGMYVGTGRILLNRESEIKEPILDLESKAFVVNGVEAPLEYSEIIKTAMKSGNLGYNPGEKTNFKIYLSDNNSFYFKGEILRVEATEKYELRYYCSGYNHNATYHLLEDKDGFYDWLDENIFVTTEENSESVENELPAA